tara:strand:- start:380 stop:1003 length:624 start_codon:yes stop_codon:yes gene_type:complete
MKNNVYLKAAEVLVKGAGTAKSNDGYVYPMYGLIDFLYSIVEMNESSFYDGDFKVRPGYAYDKFYFNRVGGSYDMSLEGLIHHIMFEEKLYHLFLNEQQISKVRLIVEESPESIYRPDIDDDNQFANDIIDVVFSVACQCVGQWILDTGADVSNFNDSGYSIGDDDGYLIFNCIQSVKDEEDISEEYDLSKLDEHTLGVLDAMKKFL